MSEVAAFDPERLVRVLGRHRVRYVLIGALAARLQGFPRVTAAADITPDRARENLEHLAAALRELEARIFTENVPHGLPFDCSARSMARADLWNLVTDAGRLDVAFAPSGTEGFDDLRRGAVRFEVFGVELLAASLADIIRSKQAADRPQDRQDVLVLKETLRRQRAATSEQAPSASMRTYPAERSVISVISAGANRRIGGPQKPVPRLTYSSAPLRV